MYEAIAVVSSWFVCQLMSILFFSGFSYEIYSRCGPSAYVYCVVCDCVTAAPYVRRGGCILAHPYTLVMIQNAPGITTLSVFLCPPPDNLLYWDIPCSVIKMSLCCFQASYQASIWEVFTLAGR